VIQPFVAENGTQRKTKTSKEQERETERDTGEEVITSTGAGG